MGSVNYIVHPDNLTQTDLRRYKHRALAAGIARAYDKNIGDPADIPGWNPGASGAVKADTVFRYLDAGGWPASIDVKSLENNATDLVVAPAVDAWLTAALAAVGTAYSCFQAVAVPQLQDQKVCVFWGVQVLSLPMAVNRLIFRNQAVAGNVIGQFDLEDIEGKDTLEGVFSEPVVIDPRQLFAAQVLCRLVTGAAHRVVLQNYLLEGAGRTVA